MNGGYINDMKWYKLTYSRATYCLIIMWRWWNVELVDCHLSLCDDCISHCMKGELVLNCFHSIWWCGWKWCVDGWNVTQTERRALKEHINILDCVQREWRREAEQCVCVHKCKEVCILYVCMYVGKMRCVFVCVFKCVWERWVVHVRSCMCANADGLVPVTLVSLIFSRWDTVSGCNTCTHTPPHTHWHTQREYRSFSEPPAWAPQLEKA